jgi:hypothetical protein
MDDRWGSRGLAPNVSLTAKRILLAARIGDVLAEIFANVLPAYAIVSALALFAGTVLRRVKRRRL